MIKLATKSADDTQGLASNLASTLRNGDIVLLVGDIGAGKTTFAQGLGHGLGVDEAITSPTFVLWHTYSAPIPLHHVDIYRLDHLQEVIDLGLMEVLDDGGVALIEWGDLASPVLPRDLLEVHIEIDADQPDARTIELNSVGDAWAAREPELKHVLGQWMVTL